METGSFKIVNVALWIVGAFYVFAGHTAIRAVLRWRVLDCGMAAVENEFARLGRGKPAARRSFAETAREVWLLVAAYIILAGGLALMLRIDAAVWFFAASAFGQAFYLLVAAPHYFDIEDPPLPEGRRQTVNAFILYAAATAFVIWAELMGLLTGWRELALLPLAGVGGLLAGYGGYVFWQYAWPLGFAHRRSFRQD